ncbi:MAG: hypothetical protein ABIA93_01250 [Candidatus Woesearchaeota archaeon]
MNILQHFKSKAPWEIAFWVGLVLAFVLFEFFGGYDKLSIVWSVLISSVILGSILSALVFIATKHNPLKRYWAWLPLIWYVLMVVLYVFVVELDFKAFSFPIFFLPIATVSALSILFEKSVDLPVHIAGWFFALVALAWGFLEFELAREIAWQKVLRRVIFIALLLLVTLGLVSCMAALGSMG